MSDSLDISHYQYEHSEINWPLVEQQHPLFVGIKATEGTNYFDPTFNKSRQGARWAKYRMFYHWVKPSSKYPIQKQFENFVAHVGDLHEGEGVFLDVEENGVSLQNCLDLVNLLEARYGRPCGIYVGLNNSTNSAIYHSKVLFNGSRPRILPAYGKNSGTIDPAYEAALMKKVSPDTPDIWQFTSLGKFPGIDPRGGLDLDKVYTEERLRLACGYHLNPPPVKFVVPTSNNKAKDPDMAKLVRMVEAEMEEDGKTVKIIHKDIAIYSVSGNLASWFSNGAELDICHEIGSVGSVQLNDQLDDYEVVELDRLKFKALILISAAPTYDDTYGGIKSGVDDFRANA